MHILRLKGILSNSLGTRDPQRRLEGSDAMLITALQIGHFVTGVLRPPWLIQNKLIEASD